MKPSNLVSLAVSVLFASLVEHGRAELELSAPDRALLRFYDKDNCVVDYHKTGVKDFQRAECLPTLKPDSCVTGKFRSYRLEGVEGTDGVPKLDEWLVKYNATDCDFSKGKYTSLMPHRYYSHSFFAPGCHNFADERELGISPDFINSYKCSWATFSKQG